MRRLRVIVPLLLPLALPHFSLRAAETPALPAGVDADKLKARLADYQARLQLTPEQKEQLTPILRDDLEWLRDWKVRFTNQHNRRDRRQLLRELRGHQGTVEKQIEPLLTAAQQKTWKQIRDERRAEIKQAYQERSEN